MTIWPYLEAAVIFALGYVFGAVRGYGIGVDDVRVRPPIWKRWRA